MASHTHDASTSSDCGCKKGGVIGAHVESSRDLEPILVEYVGTDESPITYIGKVTGTRYMNLLEGSLISVYYADYRADPYLFNIV